MQLPATQVVSPPGLLPQSMSQAPQWLGSVLVLAQRPPQQAWPSPQASQAEPQWAGSRLASTHAPPQFCCVGWQVAPLDFDVMDELYDLRVLIEGHAARHLSQAEPRQPLRELAHAGVGVHGAVVGDGRLAQKHQPHQRHGREQRQQGAAHEARAPPAAWARGGFGRWCHGCSR